jgi:methionine salvage enolase-phosphatase E1
MKRFNEFVKENMSNQSNRDAAISNSIKRKAADQERVIDTSRNSKAKDNARSKLKTLRHRSLEHDLGISVSDFTKIFNKVHSK